jgi:hypothetical protein
VLGDRAGHCDTHRADGSGDEEDIDEGGEGLCQTVHLFFLSNVPAGVPVGDVVNSGLPRKQNAYSAKVAMQKCKHVDKCHEITDWLGEHRQWVG